MGERERAFGRFLSEKFVELGPGLTPVNSLRSFVEGTPQVPDLANVPQAFDLHATPHLDPWLTARLPVRSSIMLYRLIALVALVARCATHMSNPTYCTTACFCASFCITFDCVSGCGGGVAAVRASICAPHACLRVIARARLRSPGLSFAATAPRLSSPRPRRS